MFNGQIENSVRHKLRAILQYYLATKKHHVKHNWIIMCETQKYTQV